MRWVSAPSIRCAVTRAVLRQVGRLPEPTRGSILRAFGSAAIERVDSKLEISWLPLSRECGGFLPPVEMGERRFRITYRDWAEIMRNRPAWSLAFVGTFRGFATQLGLQGVARQHDYDPTAASVD